MKLSIPFSEISEIIKTKIGKEVILACVNHNTVSVRVKLFVIPSPAKKVEVVGMRGNDLCLRMGNLVNLVGSLFAGVQKYLSVMDDGLTAVHLNEIDKLEEVLDKIAIDRIAFDDNGANVEFHLKSF